MVENKDLREEQDKGGSNPNEIYDVDYFRTKFALTTEQVVEAIREAKTSSSLELEEYLAKKFGLPEDNPDQGNV